MSGLGDMPDFNKMSDREYSRWRREQARRNREWLKTPEAARIEAELEAERRQAMQHMRGDRDWERSVRGILGDDLDAIADALGVRGGDEDVRAAREAVRQANAFKARGREAKAKRVLRRNANTIKAGVAKQKKSCVVLLVLGIAYAVLLAAVVASGAHDVWASVMAP